MTRWGTACSSRGSCGPSFSRSRWFPKRESDPGTISLMQLSDIFLRLGEETFQQLMHSVSMGRLRTYQLFDRVKARLHLHKLNAETLRKASPRMWARLKEDKDDEFATDLAQAILASNLDMI